MGQCYFNITNLKTNFARKRYVVINTIVIFSFDQEYLAQLLFNYLRIFTSVPEPVIRTCTHAHTHTLAIVSRNTYSCHNPPINILYVKTLIVETCRVPHYEQRLRSLHYKKKFSASIAELTPRMRAVLEASRQVARSRRLRKLLELVLALGNYVNRGNARGNACGFKLASLNRLVDTKSSCSKGTTLLHYLVQMLESRFREVLEIEQDMPHVRTAAKVSMADLQKEMTNLKNGLQDVQREIGKIMVISML